MMADVAELWANAENALLEAADAIAGAAVAADFLIDVAHKADLNLLCEELRRAQSRCMSTICEAARSPGPF
jgi:hypothetical protein